MQIVLDKVIKVIKFSELITKHKFWLTIILIKSWHQVPGKIHEQNLFLKACYATLTFSSFEACACPRTFITDLLFYFRSAFHSVGRLFLIGMLIVFILMAGMLLV